MSSTPHLLLLNKITTAASIASIPIPRLAFSLVYSSPKVHLFSSASSSRLLPRPPTLSSSLTVPRVLSTFNIAMGDAPDAGMDAVQRRLMFDDEYNFPPFGGAPPCPPFFTPRFHFYCSLICSVWQLGTKNELSLSLSLTVYFYFMFIYLLVVLFSFCVLFLCGWNVYGWEYSVCFRMKCWRLKFIGFF